MLWLIGIGLCDENDLSLRAWEALKKADRIYLESYTSVSRFNLEKVKKELGKKVLVVNREFVESSRIVDEARKENVALLVIGDALSATTHSELILEAKKKKIKFEIIHNASIITAVSDTGLQIYNFGKTTSIPFWQKNFEPESFYDVILENLERGMHTLMLLDLDPDLLEKHEEIQKEFLVSQNRKAILRGRSKNSNNKFLTIKNALEILEKVEERRNKKIINDKIKLVTCARIGCKNSLIKYQQIKKLKEIDFGEAPYCLVYPGKLHFKEEEFLTTF